MQHQAYTLLGMHIVDHWRPQADCFRSNLRGEKQYR